MPHTLRNKAQITKSKKGNAPHDTCTARLYTSLLRISGIIGLGLTLFALAPVSMAAEQDRARAFTIFAGRYTIETTGDSANPFHTNHENSYVAGIAYAHDLRTLARRGATGWETGFAGRSGERVSAEVWGGVYVRHRGIPVFGILIKPALTVGLSAVDRAIGTEREREARNNGDARLLYYFGPELALSSARQRDWELTYRLHHRSGGMKTLGNMSEGHNANTIGLRRRF